MTSKFVIYNEYLEPRVTTVDKSLLLVTVDKSLLLIKALKPCVITVDKSLFRKANIRYLKNSLFITNRAWNNSSYRIRKVEFTNSE